MRDDQLVQYRDASYQALADEIRQAQAELDDISLVNIIRRKVTNAGVGIAALVAFWAMLHHIGHEKQYDQMVQRSSLYFIRQDDQAPGLGWAYSYKRQRLAPVTGPEPFSLYGWGDAPREKIYYVVPRADVYSLAESHRRQNNRKVKK